MAAGLGNYMSDLTRTIPVSGKFTRRQKQVYHAVLRVFREEGRGPVFLAGFSLGGNVVLKLAGELGEAARPLIRAVCAVSTPLDLEACARRLAQPGNRLYELRFVRRMRARLLATGLYTAADLSGLRTLFAIDDRITAPSFGFGGASHYYRTQSAMGYLGGLRPESSEQTVAALLDVFFHGIDA